eukprot:gene2403-65504_t
MPRVDAVVASALLCRKCVRWNRFGAAAAARIAAELALPAV